MSDSDINLTCAQCGQPDSYKDGLCKDCYDAGHETIFPANELPVDVTLDPTPPIDNDATIIPQRTSPAMESVRSVGDYDLIEEIARGGMGVVYKAKHRNLNRVSAVKMILGGRFSSEEELQRFRVEAESAAKLDHPAIVPIFEIGEHDGQAFFAMKFVDGGSLAEKASTFIGKPRDAADVMIKVAEGVHHAHQRGVLHRDLKPANILLDRTGEPFVTDLGLAKSTSGGSDLTQTGAVLGTPSYMPPEQAAGKSVTTAADIYSLGAILYQLLVGNSPYQGDTSVSVVMQVIDGPPPAPRSVNPDVDRNLELICNKAMAREPEDRYSSAQQMANDLKAWMAGDSISVRPPSIRAIVANWLNQNQKLVYVMFALLFGMLLCAPVAIAFLSADFAEIYSEFSDDNLPWLYSFQFPIWLSAVSMITLFLVIWPSIGFFNASISKPKTRSAAFYYGVVLASALSLIFYCMLGWLIFLQGARMNMGPKVGVLANAVWPTEEDGEAVRAANSLFGGLEEIPVEKRAKLVKDRVIADHFSSVLGSFGICVLAVLIFSVPIVVGTLIAFVLQNRGLPLWLSIPRYLIAWWALAACSVGVTLSITSFFNNEFVMSSDWSSVPIAISIFLVIAWLAMRQWKKPAQKVAFEGSRA